MSVPVPTAPGYLATVSSAPTAAYGAQRVISGYSGPLFRLVRASDSATMDVSPQTGGDYPDYAAITTWMGTSGATVSIVYDQTGNGLNLTQATATNQPSFDPTQKTGNVVPILIDGYGRSSTSGLPQVQVAKTLSVGGLSLDLISHSIFMTVAPKVSYNNDAFVQSTNDAVSTAVAELFTQNGTVTLRTNATNDTNQNGAPRFSIDTIGYTSTSTQRSIYDKGAIRAIGTSRTTTAIPRITVGSSITGSTGYNGMFKLFGMVVYPTALDSVTDGPNVVASLNTAFATPATYDYAILFTGDSVMEGSGGLLLRSIPNWVQTSLTKKAEIFNTAVHGQTLATDYSTRTKAATLFRTGVPNIAFIEAGANDLPTGTTGATLYTTATNYITYLKSLGYKVVINTIPPINPTGWSGSMETQRGNYNALVIANSGGADYVLDLTQHPVMASAGAYNDPTLWQPDHLHPTALGYEWLAGAPSGTFANQYTAYYALQQVLGTTP